MKTIKKIVPFFILACLLGGMAISCEDDCGCEPRISHVITSSITSPVDSIIVASSAGSSIIIVGENLASVTGISFVNTSLSLNFPVTLNSSFVTDNAIILKVPQEVDQTTTEMVLTTSEGRVVSYPFAVNIPAPRIDMFYSEFVEAGDVLRIKGAYFFDPKVFFITEDGKTEFEATDVTLVGSSIAKVTVPDQLGTESYSNMTIKMVTQAGTSFSEILFRDRRNIIFDFDNKFAADLGMLKQGILPVEWRDDNDLFIEASDMFDLPEIGCDRGYTAINQTSYGPDNGSVITGITSPDNLEVNLLGEFVSRRIRDLVLKFEIYVPASHPIKNKSANIYLTTKQSNASSLKDDLGRTLTNKPADEYGSPGAFWNPMELKIKKEGDEWSVDNADASVKDFYTDGWMTVTIPLSSFVWNPSLRDLRTNMSSFGMSDPYTKADATLNPNDIYNIAFLWNPTAGDGNQPANFIAFFDNFRIVPEDGGGAIFGKFGARTGTESWWGVSLSLRHFDNQ